MKKFFAWPMAIIFMGLGILLSMSATPAYAGKKVWEDGDSSLTLFGDMRLRVELDDDSKKDDTRDRWRIRLRPGMKFVYNKTASMGFRLRTATGSIQSPHQTLEVGDPSGNQQFGVDRAYFKLKFGGFYVWGGKNGFNIWNPNEVLWDSDLQPEGLALGFKTGGLHIGLSRFIINEAGEASGSARRLVPSSPLTKHWKLVTQAGTSSLALTGLISS